MSAYLEALARRAVACGHWRWMPGMRWSTEDDHGRLDDYQPEYMGRPGDALPDFRDPATIGCLLALLRKAYHQPRIVAVPMANDKWGVAIPSVLRTTDRFRSDTEAEALVKALEAAP
jgi:hypothetical protein